MTINGRRSFLRVVQYGLLALSFMVPCLAADYSYTFNSEPSGLVNTSGVAASGTTLTTPTRDFNTEVSGHMFAYWKVDGQRQADASGTATPAARFVLSGPTIATAVYIPTNADTDADGLPDWWEWRHFGNLAQTAAGDPESDGFQNGIEYHRGHSPRMVDLTVDGGIASRRSTAISYTGPSGAAYVFNSEPAGFVNQTGSATLGTVLQTPNLNGEVSGRTFAYWTVNGVRQAGANGAALGRATFTLNGPTTATAVYILTGEDSDADGLADWWEWQQFGSLVQTAAGDPDSDGFSNAIEFWRGTSPRMVDAVVDGGVASRRSAPLSILVGSDVTYVFNSDPTGIVNQTGVAMLGSTIRTPFTNVVVGSRSFAYWAVNGTRQADTNGAALWGVNIVVNGPTTATAVYLSTDEDSDADSLPDWWEWRYFGTLSVSPADDADGDGFSNGVEQHRGYSPRMVDAVIDGGISSRRSAVLAYAPFPLPTISAQSMASQTNAGGSVTLSVTAGGDGLTYQWRKDGVPIDGATNATYELGAITVGQAGVYTVLVSNTGGGIVSDPIPVAVVPAGTEATHELRSAGYVAGGTITVVNTLTYTGTPAALDWQVLLPANWRFVSDSGSVGQTRPAANATGLLTWEWTTIPASPIVFSYTVSVPVGTTGLQEIASLANLRITGPALRLLARTDPLIVRPASQIHSADTNGDSCISLSELTRVIELYNTRNGTIRTGAYNVQAGTEDGFAPDTTRAFGVPRTVGPYHSADTGDSVSSPERNGAIYITELLRVIELYSYRSGGVRTGQYRVQSGTVDGFAPGP